MTAVRDVKDDDVASPQSNDVPVAREQDGEGETTASESREACRTGDSVAEEPLLAAAEEDQEEFSKLNSPGAKLWERVKKTTYHLSDFTALPEYLRDNEYIMKGYRVNFSVKQALLSVFTIHNETGNIWTHLLGFLVFLGLTIYTVLHWPQKADLPTLPSLPKLGSLTGVELPSLSSLQDALPHLQLPESLSSCFHSTGSGGAAGRDAEPCIFTALPHLQLPESLSACFHKGGAAASGREAARCIFAALPHLQLPESLSSCFHVADAAAAAPGKDGDKCMFVALWMSLQAALPHVQLPESLSSCFHPAEAAGKDAERCMFQTLGQEMSNLVAPFLHQQEPNPPITRWPFLLFLSGAMVCLLTSSTCHSLGCHSKEFNNILWRFDYAGIAILISTSFYPPVYYAFLCDPITRGIYLVTITLLGLGTVMVSLLDKFQQTSYRHFRAGLFFGLGACGVIPTAHKLLVYWRQPVVIVTTMYEIGMGLLYALGAVFYASRIPERWLPGKFDLAGHSHQIFHVLVVAAALVHYKAGLEYLKWRDVESCPGILP